MSVSGVADGTRTHDDQNHNLSRQSSTGAGWPRVHGKKSTPDMHELARPAETPFPPKTGWPPSPLCQDENRRLFAWFASRLDARQRVREAAAAIRERD